MSADGAALGEVATADGDAGLRPPPPRAGRRGRRHVGARDDVLRAVREAIVDGGFARLSLEDVAVQLGVHKATVYYYVGSRERMLYESIVQPYPAILERQGQILGYPLTAVEKLRLYLRHRVSASANMPATRDERYLSDEHQDELAALRRAEVVNLIRVMEEGVASGEFRPLEHVEVRAFGILALVSGFHRWFSEAGELTRDEVADTWWDQLCHGLLAQPAAGGNEHGGRFAS